MATPDAAHLVTFNEQSIQPPSGPQQSTGAAPVFDPQVLSEAISQHVVPGIQWGMTDSFSAIVPAVIDRLSLGLASTSGIDLAATTTNLARPVSTPFTIPPGPPGSPPEVGALGSSVPAARGMISSIPESQAISTGSTLPPVPNVQSGTISQAMAVRAYAVIRRATEPRAIRYSHSLGTKGSPCHFQVSVHHGQWFRRA